MLSYNLPLTDKSSKLRGSYPNSLESSIWLRRANNIDRLPLAHDDSLEDLVVLKGLTKDLEEKEVVRQSYEPA